MSFRGVRPAQYALARVNSRLRRIHVESDAEEREAKTRLGKVIDGDTAVLVGTDTARGTRDGAAYTAVYRYTVTYIRRQGRWLTLAEHIVKVPQAM
jgi:ketosteroid isomerase-like protein